MRCNICDSALSEKEIIFNQDLQTFEPCTTCLDIALDAAYSEGFHIEDEDASAVVDPIFDESYDTLPLLNSSYATSVASATFGILE